MWLLLRAKQKIFSRISQSTFDEDQMSLSVIIFEYKNTIILFGCDFDNTIPGLNSRSTRPKSSGIMGSLFEISFFSNSSNAFNTWTLFMSNAISFAVNSVNYNGPLRYILNQFSSVFTVFVTMIEIEHVKAVLKFDWKMNNCEEMNRWEGKRVEKEKR